MRPKKSQAKAILGHVFWTIILTFSVIMLQGASNMPKQSPLEKVKTWFVLFDYQPENYPVAPETLNQYDLVVLDADHHPDFSGAPASLIKIAYVSIGEAEDYRSYWNRIKDEAWVLDENENWEGNFYVDVRQPAWTRVLIDEVLPGVVAQGFQGIFMDTLDTAELLEARDPERYEGISEAMIALVEEIHRTFPDLMLMSNNGFPLLERLGPSLSAALSEDIFSMIDFEANSYQAVPEEDREYKIEILNRLKRKYGVAVFVIDYLSREDQALARKYRADLKALGYKPYIAEGDLSQIFTELNHD